MDPMAHDAAHSAHARSDGASPDGASPDGASAGGADDTGTPAGAEFVPGGAGAPAGGSVVELSQSEMNPGTPSCPPIADYAFLSDCEANCLIAPSGAVEWMCLPRPDSPSVFGSLLDRSAGHFRISPYGVNVPAARRYLPGSMILETTWQTGTGWVIVRDALVMGPWHNRATRSSTHRRTPDDWDAEHILLRTVRCVSGTAEMEMTCEPAFDYH